MKNILKFFAIALASFVLINCDDASLGVKPQDTLTTSLFVNAKDETSEATHSIVVDVFDSLVVWNLKLLGGEKFYLALDKDLADPEMDWDDPLDSGAVIKLQNKQFVHVVSLDAENQVIAVWQIIFEAKSSSSVKQSSSSAKDEILESSSSEQKEDILDKVESSSSKNLDEKDSVETSSSSVESSSSVAIPAEVSSSSVESSSSEILDNLSSSAEISSSSFDESNVKISDLKVEKGNVIVEGLKIYVELNYGEDLSKVELKPFENTFDLRRPIELELLQENGEKEIYTVVGTMQLPGSDFNARNDFWATTSDAMATKGSSSYIVDLTISAGENATFENSAMTLTSKAVVAKGLLFNGGWKLAGGFYYAGSFSGLDCRSIYQAENKDASVDNAPADFSVYMTHGKPFEARPRAFEVRYSYNHVQNIKPGYPQQALIYVALISDDKKIVAAGKIIENETVENFKTENVELLYGNEASLLEAGFAGFNDLKLGSGNEDVAEIRVMFASSAFAFIADGGTAAFKDKNFRGGENASLTIDDFKLIY